MTPIGTVHRFEAPLRLASGAVIERPQVAYQTWGRLNAARDNAVVVCHALTGHADAADWWAGLIGAGCVLDPARHFVVCQNVLGGCYGTTGPLSENPATGHRWGGDFPRVTVPDMVALQRRLLDALGVEGVALALGGSMGGMQALEWALSDPRVRRVAMVGVGWRHTAWQVGIGEAQRLAIAADPRWQGGHYDPADPPAAGLAAARAMAMMTYRAPGHFHDRFGRHLQPGQAGTYAVESYLRYQGRKLAGRMDAVSYVRLTQAMDDWDAAAGRGTPESALGAMEKPALCVGISSDVLYPPAEARETAALLGRGRYAELASDFGHDAFLVDFAGLEALLAPFLHETAFAVPAPADP